MQNIEFSSAPSHGGRYLFFNFFRTTFQVAPPPLEGVGNLHPKLTFLSAAHFLPKKIKMWCQIPVEMQKHQVSSVARYLDSARATFDGQTYTGDMWGRVWDWRPFPTFNISVDKNFPTSFFEKVLCNVNLDPGMVNDDDLFKLTVMWSIRWRSAFSAKKAWNIYLSNSLLTINTSERYTDTISGLGSNFFL